MIYHNYSFPQLEAMADELNRKYDPRRLTEPSAVDVYDIVDFLGARIAFEFLSPDRTYLGATVFHPGTLYVWPGNPYYSGMMPEEKYFYGGTIIIDRDLIESSDEQDKLTENFTVMHECFHFDKHKAEFKHVAHLSSSSSDYGQKQIDKSNALYHIERQANYAASAFLMPREAVKQVAREMLGYKTSPVPFGYGVKGKIKKMGRLFGVNYSPMSFRLQEIGVLDWDFNPFI